MNVFFILKLFDGNRKAKITKRNEFQMNYPIDV